MRVWVVLLLAGCVTPAAPDTDAAATTVPTFDDVAGPQWHSGYRFTYALDGRITGQFEFYVEGELFQEEPFDEDLSLGPLTEEVISTRLADRGAPLYLSLVDFEGLALSAVRQSDLQDVPVEFDETITFEAPAEHTLLRFPLRSGATWSGIETTASEFGPISFQVTAIVQAVETLDLPAGRMDAVRVVHTVTLHNQATLERNLEREFEAIGMKDVDVKVEAGGTYTVSYADALQAIARLHDKNAMLMDVKGTIDGDRVRFVFDVDTDLRIDAQGASFAIGPDRDLQEVLDYLDDAQPPPPLVPKISIAPAPPINAAENRSVTFTLKSDVPDGHTVAWSLHDAAGPVADGEGEAFSHTFTAPGRHTLRADLVDADVVASHSIPVIATYEGTLDGTCPAVVLLDVVPCDAVTITLGQEVPRLSVTARPDGLGLPGTVILTAPNGTSHEASVSFPEAGDWTMHWQATADVRASVAYDVSTTTAQEAPEGTRAMPLALATALERARGLV